MSTTLHLHLYVYNILKYKEHKKSNVTSVILIFREYQKHETWKTTWRFLMDILTRMKGPSIKTNMRTIRVILTVIYSNI